MCGKNGSQSDGMLSFVVTVVCYIIISRANLQFFTQTPHSVPTSLFVASQPYWGLGRIVVEVTRSQTASYTTFGRIPLDKGSVRRRGLYSQQTHMPPAGFEPAIPASAWAAYLRLRPRGCWNQHCGFHLSKNIYLDSNTFGNFIFIH